MGSSKAWLPVGGECMLQRVARTVGEVVKPMVVAAGQRQVLPPLPRQVEVVRDRVPGAGPLAGLLAGVEQLSGRANAVFVISCDHPLVHTRFIRRLIALLGDAPAIIPTHEGHTYPLVAVYRLEACIVLPELMAAGELRVLSFARRCRARFLPSSLLVDADPDLLSLRNVNDPAQYAGVCRKLRARASP